MITSPVPTQASPSLPRLAPSYISPQPVSTLISSTFSSSSSLSASSSISITPTALSNLNAILDRILFLVLSSAQSLDPRDLREAGVGTVFRWEGEGEGDKMQKLGLEAIKEAEIELTVWRDKARITSTSTSTPEAKSSSAAVAPASEPAAPSTSISSTRASSPSLENAKGSSPLQEWSNAARVKNNGRVGGQVEVPERDQKPFDKYKKGLRRHSKNQNQNQSQSHSPGNAIGTRIDTATKDGIVKEGCPGSTQFEFPIKEAFEMVRIRVMNYCTLSSLSPDPNLIRQSTLLWYHAGGSRSEDIIAPAALYLTAIIEYIGEHILASVARIVVRDVAAGTAVQGQMTRQVKVQLQLKVQVQVHDLYVALCEDEAMWGLFKNMDEKMVIEAGLLGSGSSWDVRNQKETQNQQPPQNQNQNMQQCKRQQRQPQKHLDDQPVPPFYSAEKRKPAPQISPDASTPTPNPTATVYGIRASASAPEFFRHVHDPQKKLPEKNPKTSSSALPGVSFHQSSPSVSSTPSTPQAATSNTHQRSSSALSGRTKELWAAANHSAVANVDSTRTPSTSPARYGKASEDTIRSGKEKQDEFEALIMSGQTMKVSLTPGRLKRYDPSVRAGGTSPGAVTTPTNTPSATVSPVRKGSVSNPTKLTPRSPIPVGNDEGKEELADASMSGKRRVIPISIPGNKQETLKDILSSEPPWAPTPTSSRQAAAHVIAPTPQQHGALVANRESVQAAHPIKDDLSSGPEIKQLEDKLGLGAQSKVTTSWDMMYFLNLSAPPGGIQRTTRAPPAAAAEPAPPPDGPSQAIGSLHDASPGLRGPSALGSHHDDDEDDVENPGLGVGLVKINRQKKPTATSDLADFFANTAPPPHHNSPLLRTLTTPDLPSKQSKFKSLFSKKNSSTKELPSSPETNPFVSPSLGRKIVFQKSISNLRGAPSAY